MGHVDSHREGGPAGPRHERPTPPHDEEAGDALVSAARTADDRRADAPAADDRRAAARAGDEQRVGGRRPVDEPAADSVCWLDRVCPECGGLADGAPAPVCPRCGTPRA